MPIDLTAQQQDALREGRAIRLMVPSVGREVIIFGSDLVESIEDVLEDERERAAFREFARKQAARVARENPW